MDDDIRDRFRGARRERPEATGYGRPIRRPIPAQPPSSPPASPPKQRLVTPPSAAASLPESPKAPTRTAPVATRRRKRRVNSKLLLAFLLIFIIALAGGGGFWVYKKHAKKQGAAANNIQLSSSDSNASTPKSTGTIRFIATGDNLAFESINNAAKKPDGTYDYVPLMSSLKPFFEKADIRLCNQSTPAGGDALGLSAFPNFNAPLAWSTSFAGLGCNVMNLGTDHTNDKGQAAIDTMANTWEGQKETLAFAGANKSAEEQNKIRYFTVKGVKFAFLSYTTRSNSPPTNNYGINLYSDNLAKTQITEARKSADLVIVSMNWGTENSPDINADQERVSQFLATQNADIVIGVGPHVIQPTKVLDGTEGHQTLVWFSLGNFLNSQVPTENLIGGMAIMDIDVATQQIIDPKLLPFYMHYEWTAAQRKAQSQADLLARHDFKLYPLDQAAEALARSQNNTTVQAQTERVQSIITKYVPIKVITSSEF